MSPFPAPESVLVMDNAPTHDHDAIHALCARFGVICVFLPPYSYDLNPIELSFHEAKQYIRRTFGLADDVVSGRLYVGLTSVTAEHALNYYIHCGYTITDNDRRWAGIIP